MSLRSTRDIVGKIVLTQDGREVGHVEGIDLDVDTWQAKAVELKLRRDALEALRIKRPLFGTRTARLGIQHVSGITDSLVLKISVKELGERLADLDGGEAAADETQRDASTRDEAQGKDKAQAQAQARTKDQPKREGGGSRS